jgi:2-keto-4-pentenoate hydratase/2-oxohepta-3-ene-1,7-dioic acid hydratase in catechol pathway
MRLISFSAPKPSFGLINSSGGVVDLGKRFAPDMVSLRQWLSKKGGNVASVSELMGSPADYRLDEVTLLPVVPDPAHVWCLAINYQEHIEEIKALGIERECPAHPAVFMRYPDTLIAHNQSMILPRVSTSLDWEGELAVIIGKGGRYISESDALSHIAGYSCFNDGSVRDWQFHTRQIAPGKNFAGTGALGPWLVTADEIADPQDLAISVRVNGELMQDGHTSDMIFTIKQFIAYVSSILPLQAGDVLATGTPSGVGFSRRPQIFMKSGDVCEVAIEKVGTLVNRVQAE